MEGMDDMSGMHDMHHMNMNATNCTCMNMDMNGTMDMDMKMYFHFGFEDHVLFKKWSADSNGVMFATCLFFFVLAIAYEVFKHYRQLHATKAEKNLIMSVSEDNGTVSNFNGCQGSGIVQNRTVRPTIRMLSAVHLTQTVLHMIQMFVSYLLMLAFMTFNVYICLSVILGAGIGYFLIGTRRVSSFSGFEDHCH